MNKDEKIAVAIIAACFVPPVFAAVEYFKIVRVERAKRKQIEIWEQESIALIRETHDRTMKKLMDRNVPLNEALEYMIEQQKFVRQVTQDKQLDV